MLSTLGGVSDAVTGLKHTYSNNRNKMTQNGEYNVLESTKKDGSSRSFENCKCRADVAGMANQPL